MTTDHAVRLDAILDNLEHNRMSLADAVAQVRELKFPAARKSTVAQAMAGENDVPGKPAPGGFHEVQLAYLEHRITYRQYEALAEAAAVAIRREGGEQE